MTLWNGYGIGGNDYCVSEAVDLIRIYPEPIALFMPSDTIGCEPLYIEFTDQSNTIDDGFNNHGGSNYIENWEWYFGDENVDLTNTQSTENTFNVNNSSIL